LQQKKHTNAAPGTCLKRSRTSIRAPVHSANRALQADPPPRDEETVMKHLPPEPFDRRSYLAWVAHFRSIRGGGADFDDVPRRSEAFAEDVEHLTPAAPAVAAARHRDLPAAVRASPAPARHWVAA
jgi:hypothetical protein